MCEIHPNLQSVTETLERAGINVLADTGITMPDEIAFYELEPIDVLGLIHRASDMIDHDTDEIRAAIRQAIDGITLYQCYRKNIDLTNACERLADEITRAVTSWSGWEDGQPPPPPPGWPGWTITMPDHTPVISQ